MDSKSSYTSLNTSLSREDEESSQTSSLDTLLGKPSVRWSNEKDRDSGTTNYRGIKFSTALIVHALLISAFGGTWLLLWNFYGYEYPFGPNLMQSPAKSAVRYVKQTLDTNLYIKSVFFAPPGPEIDAAWDHLLLDKYAAVSPTELLPEESVIINDVTGRALITLEVFHSLECLNYIRKFTFRSHYNISGSHKEVERFGQCIETVRQTISCYADISLNTYAWRKNTQLPYPDFRIDHECKDWGSIQQWARDHSLPPLGDEMLDHPTFGMNKLPNKDNNYVIEAHTFVQEPLASSRYTDRTGHRLEIVGFCHERFRVVEVCAKPIKS